MFVCFFYIIYKAFSILNVHAIFTTSTMRFTRLINCSELFLFIIILNDKLDWNKTTTINLCMDMDSLYQQIIYWNTFDHYNGFCIQYTCEPWLIRLNIYIFKIYIYLNVSEKFNIFYYFKVIGDLQKKCFKLLWKNVLRTCNPMKWRILETFMSAHIFKSYNDAMIIYKFGSTMYTYVFVSQMP